MKERGKETKNTLFTATVDMEGDQDEGTQEGGERRTNRVNVSAMDTERERRHCEHTGTAVGRPALAGKSCFAGG